MFKACIGLNCVRTIDFIDHRHCSLTFIPDDVYRNEQTLEDLLLDCNMLQELPAVRITRGCCPAVSGCLCSVGRTAKGVCVVPGAISQASLFRGWPVFVVVVFLL